MNPFPFFWSCLNVTCCTMLSRKLKSIQNTTPAIVFGTDLLPLSLFCKGTVTVLLIFLCAIAFTCIYNSVELNQMSHWETVCCAINDQFSFETVWAKDLKIWIEFAMLKPPTTNPLSVWYAAPDAVCRTCFPSIHPEETLMWMGVMCEPMNVCKYCICVWKESINILLVISAIVKDF